MTIYNTDTPSSRPYSRRSHRLVFRAPSRSRIATPPSDASTDYGIDLVLDEEDEKAIDKVFEALAKGQTKTIRSFAPAGLDELPSNELPQLQNRLLENDNTAVEEIRLESNSYMDEIAVDEWLDLQLDNVELAIDDESVSTIYDLSDDDIDKQVLRDHERWLERASTSKRPELAPQPTETEQPVSGLELVEQQSSNIIVAPHSLQNNNPEHKSPLVRFRTRKNPVHTRLSVTDLLSNMWCEQQFHYTLLRGFKLRTPAMKAGTKLHRKIEEEVHTVVPVETKTIEDRWGVRIWNMLQGMDALRHGGVTREFEVWGWVEGVWVVGVIDEIGFEKFEDPTHEWSDEPTSEEKLDLLEDIKSEIASNMQKDTVQMEPVINPTVKTLLDNDATTTKPVTGASAEPVKEVKKRGRPRKNPLKTKAEEVATPTTPKRRSKKQKSALTTPDAINREQHSILSFLSPASTGTPDFPDAKPAYILDLKTRTMNSVPKFSSSQSIGTSLQLMLYHQLLEDLLASETTVVTEKLCALHELSVSTPFSDSFIAQISNLDATSTSLSLDVLLENNSIEKLFALFHRHLKETISHIKPEMTVVYRFQKSGNIIGSQEYEFNANILAKHVRNVMSWWKGERETVGVEIEEAWKCQGCEFNEHCSWRLQKIDEVAEVRRKRKEELSRKRT